MNILSYYFYKGIYYHLQEKRYEEWFKTLYPKSQTVSKIPSYIKNFKGKFLNDEMYANIEKWFAIQNTKNKINKTKIIETNFNISFYSHKTDEVFDYEFIIFNKSTTSKSTSPTPYISPSISPFQQQTIKNILLCMDIIFHTFDFDITISSSSEQSHKTSKHKTSKFIIIPTDYKKVFDIQNEIPNTIQNKPLSSYHINSGITMYVSNTLNPPHTLNTPNKTITNSLIFRKEEMYKVFIHEIIHSLNVDKITNPKEIPITNPKTTPTILQEAYTETIANIIIGVVFVWHNQLLKDTFITSQIKSQFPFLKTLDEIMNAVEYIENEYHKEKMNEIIQLPYKMSYKVSHIKDNIIAYYFVKTFMYEEWWNLLTRKIIYTMDDCQTNQLNQTPNQPPNQTILTYEKTENDIYKLKKEPEEPKVLEFQTHSQSQSQSKSHFSNVRWHTLNQLLKNKNTSKWIQSIMKKTNEFLKKTQSTQQHPKSISLCMTTIDTI